MNSEFHSAKNNPAGAEPEVEKVKPPRALLAAVIIMGVLLVIGFIVVIATVIFRVSQSDAKNTSLAATSAPLAVETLIPAGAQVRSMQLNGANLVIHIAPKTGEGGEIIVYDIKKSRERARFILKQK